MFKRAPIVKTQVLIRKPVEEVFEAFVNPEITSKFRFTESTGRLEPGKEVRCVWERYGMSAKVRAKAVERHRRIQIEWGDPPLLVECGDETTHVSISNWGFNGSDEVVRSFYQPQLQSGRYFGMAKPWQHG
jgi:uncharacterized protein YndB with AHSA1/START domain